jgi:hypothetical protein
VPGLPAESCIDIAISIWPFPLESEPQTKLESLGYELISGGKSGPEQRLRHATGNFQLFILEAGETLWTDYRLMRDYWRGNENARLAYSRRKQEWITGDSSSPMNSQSAKEQFFLETLDEARQWWIIQNGFAPVETVANDLQGFRSHWYVSGGWALDLFLDRVTRVHHDVDVVVPRSDQFALQDHLTMRGWGLMTPWQGKLEAWPMHMRLEMPRHQIHAFREGRFIDFQLSDIEHGVWQYRRDPGICRSIERIGLKNKSDIPFLAPELVLLFKSKNTSGRDRPKDLPDFEKVHPHLEPERRAWLLWALTATDPAHPWIEQLGQGLDVGYKS